MTVAVAGSTPLSPCTVSMTQAQSLAVLFGANIGVFQAPVFSWFDFITGYLMIPVFIILYLGHKIRNKTRLVPLKECNFESD